ncbi:hypothetical protein ACVW0P_002561 [Mucilaginibacter sp. UYNi724]
MRKIYNDKKLKETVEEFAETLFINRKFEKPLVTLRRITRNPNKKNKYGVSDININGYVGKIIREYKRILCAGPKEISILIQEFDRIIHHDEITTEFHEDIVAAMRYKELRNREFLTLLQQMNIKNCIYCHAQLAIVVVDDYYLIANPIRGAVAGDIKTRRGLLQLDHRYPKSKYPFLCTSFYNLYPTCSYCNNIKSAKDSDFGLYSDIDNVEVFRFSLTDESVIDYWDKNKAEALKIAISPVGLSAQKAKIYLEMFDIQQIYDTQKDLVEELLHKKMVYNDPYKKQLIEDFRQLFPDQSIIDRLIIGNYDQPEDVLKRPMAKFVQDISRDIGLIK